MLIWAIFKNAFLIVFQTSCSDQWNLGPSTCRLWERILSMSLYARDPSCT